MMKKVLIAFWLVLLYSHSDGQLNQKLKHCDFDGTDGSALCGTYPVFENRQTKKGRRIDLNIVVIPAANRVSGNNPIFYFDGGPGIGATKNVQFIAQRGNPYRENRDVVLIDVRGTGASNPLHCESLQSAKDLQEQLGQMYPAERVRECFRSLSKNAELTQYTTTNIAGDVEEVRRWLGYGRVHLFGLSYGTRLAQEYMRRFPSSVESVVLHAPISTNGRMPLFHARFAQDTLNKLIKDCSNDERCRTAFPSLAKEFDALMRNGRKRPFSFSHTTAAGEKQLSLSWDAFQTKLRSLMYQPATMRTIPFIIHEAYRGNWKPFISLYPNEEVFSDFSAEGLYLSITCSEDVPFITGADAERLTRNTFMGTYRIRQQKIACSNWSRGEIPRDFLRPVKSGVRVLILAGEYDPVTPVSLAKDIARHLPNSQLVVVPEMSHMPEGLSNEECFDRMVLEFLDKPGVRVNFDCVKTMKPPPYRTGE